MPVLEGVLVPLEAPGIGVADPEPVGEEAPDLDSRESWSSEGYAGLETLPLPSVKELLLRELGSELRDSWETSGDCDLDPVALV